MPLYLGTNDAGTDQFSLQDFEPSEGDKFHAAWREAWLESYGPVAKDWFQSRIGGDGPKLSAVEAQSVIQESGAKLRITPKDGEYSRPQLDVLTSRQRELAQIKDVRERTPWSMGSVVRGTAMFGAGIVDPINLATAWVPWTKTLTALNAARAATTAGTTFAARTAARAAIGAADAGISTAVLEPGFYQARQHLGDDYSAMDSIANIAFGTAFGGGVHVIGGAAADVFRRGGGTSSIPTPNPVAEPIAPPAGAAMGAQTFVKVGESREPAQFAVVEADTLSATVGKADNQFRDRSRTAYQTEIQKRANSLDPDMVLSTDNPLMDVGTPTVAADGRIIGGNGRTLFIDRAYEIGKGDGYRAALESRLEQLGIDPASVQGMKKPVLVRRLQNDVDVREAAMASNEGGSTDMSALEQSKVDAERLGDARLTAGADGSLQAPENRAAIRRWVEAQPENKRNSLVDEDGKLSAEGSRRLNAALLYKAYGDSPTLGRLVESMDPGSRNLAMALGRTAPVVAEARGSIAAGELHPLDIAADIQQAVEKYNVLREQGTKVADYMNQMDAFGDGMTAEAVLLLDAMSRNIGSPRRMADIIAGFYAALDEAGNPKQTDMFGAGGTPDKLAMLDDAIQKAETSLDTAGEIVAGVSPETREAALRASVAQAVDGRSVDVEAVIGMDGSRSTHGLPDVVRAADRNFEPENAPLADFETSALVDARNKAAPKDWDLQAAEQADADADLALAETVKAGDQAYKYSRGEGGVTVTSKTDEATGLPLNSDGTVTLYHHTSAANADAIKSSGQLKADAEPDVYLTTRKETDTGYGDTAVAVRVKPESLQIDDEFPDGRVDYRISAGRPGGSVRVAVGEPRAAKLPPLKVEVRSTSEKIDMPAIEGGPTGERHTYTAHLPDGTEVGTVSFNIYSDGTAVPEHVEVPEQYRLQTVASQMYKQAEADGLKVVPSDHQSPAGKAFSEARLARAAGTDPRYALGDQFGTSAPEALQTVLRESFGDSTDALVKAGRIEVVNSPADMPGGPHPADVKAFAAPDGKVYVAASNVTPSEVRGLMLHEVGVHVGMKNMLGAETFDSVLSQLDEAISSGQEWAQAARASVPADTPAHLVREEQLAYLVQHSPEMPIVQRIIAAVRAWAYRTFKFAQGLKLTDADFRAMAVSALHDAARGRDAAGAGAYSRGATPDPATAADELKPYADRVARAKQYSGVLRAAADKLDNDAAATDAMRAAMPDISPVEITDLLDGLRKQVKGLRGVARSARAGLASEDVASSLQYDAMQAADTLANNIEKAAVIDKRNAALNLNARLKAGAFINQFRDAGLDVEGFRALLVGTERKRTGGRLSVEAEQKSFKGAWIGGITSDMQKADVWQAFVSGDFDEHAYIALSKMNDATPDFAGLTPEAVKIAEIVHKYQTDARNTRNRFGAWIRDLKGYITRQSHDMYKIRSAGEKLWKERTLPLLDVQRTLRDYDGTIDDFLTHTYDDFAAGSHMKPPAGETDLPVGVGSSLAKRESVSRVLYFKDGAASYAYNKEFGAGRLADSVLHGLDQAASSVGLLKVLGTNPEATVTRLFDEYAETLRGDPARRAKFLSSRKEVVSNLLGQVDGSTNIPGNVTAAKVGSFLRSWQSMAKLGGALISSVTDLTNYAAELRFGQDKNLFSGVLDGIGAVVQGRAKGEKADILNSLGVFHESTLGSVYARFDSPELVGGKMSALMQLYFKANGLSFWTESLRDGYALQHSSYLASNARHTFDKLPDGLRDMLGLYNIDAGKWDILRIASLKEADGRQYMTPDGLKTVPVAALENYIKQVGRTPSEAAIMNLQDDLASALRTMTIDRTHHAVIEPGARSRAFMLRGTQPGTVPGEVLRYVSQFKSFPVAMIQMTLGREVYGRGYDTIGDYLKNGKGDMLGLVTFIGLSTMMGYAAMSAKDLLRGKNPRPVDDPRTWAAAMVQGGGLGIYGDFLFGKFNRMGGSLSGSMGGPVVNLADTAADLWTRARTGDDLGAVAFNAALSNTPFANIFYTRAALDYLILYRMQEAMNPGFLRRMEKRAERENGQTFFLPPSQVAR